MVVEEVILWAEAILEVAILVEVGKETGLKVSYYFMLLNQEEKSTDIFVVMHR